MIFPYSFCFSQGCQAAVLSFLLSLSNTPPPMKTVYTIRLQDEYAGMLANIKLELSERGIDVKDNVLLKTILLTGIRDINRMITQGINIFDNNERDPKADD